METKQDTTFKRISDVLFQRWLNKYAKSFLKLNKETILRKGNNK